MGAPAQARADALHTSGAAWAQAGQTIGNTIQGTIGDWIKYQAAAPRRQLEALQVQKLTDAEKEDAHIKDALAAAGGDPQKALTDLRSRGAIGVSAASKLQSQIVQEGRAQIDDTQKTIDIAGKKLTLSTQLLQGVESAPEDQKPAAYAKVLPQIRAYVGPQLGAQLPDTYDPTVVSQASSGARRRHSTSNSSASRSTTPRKPSRTAATPARRISTSRNPSRNGSRRLGINRNWIRHSRPSGGWRQSRPRRRAPGSATRSPRGRAALRAKFGLTPAEREKQLPTAGTFEDYLTRWARDVVNKPVQALNPGEVERARKRYTEAGRVPPPEDLPAGEKQQLVNAVIAHPDIWSNLTDSKKSAIAAALDQRGFTQFGMKDLAMKATAERWRQEQLWKVDQEFEVGQELAKLPDNARPFASQGKPTMTAAQRDARKLEIEKSYRTQISQLPPPAAANHPAPTPAVVQMLTGKAAKDAQGRDLVYTLSDGSKWTITPQGPKRVP